MSKFFLVIILALSLMGGFFYGQVMAQEQGEAQAEISTLKLVNGTVTNVSPEEIMVKKYDYSTYDYVEESYVIDTNSKIVNVDSLANIVVGDTVDIEYVVEAEKRIVKTLAVVKLVANPEPAAKAEPAVKSTTVAKKSKP